MNDTTLPEMLRAVTVLLVFSLVTVVKARASGRIIGGNDVTIEEVPYQVSLVHYGEYTCGGAIIKANVILTTAHCLENIDVRRLKVRSGTSYTSSGTLSFVLKVTLHPSYSDNENDIGLVWLQEPLRLGPTRKEVQLPKQDAEPNAGSVAKVTGWGYISGHGPNAYHLKAAKIPIVDRKICEDSYAGHVQENMICAGLPEGGVDACNNDSGSPLVVDGLLVGLVSWSVACGLSNYPGVYTNVAYFRDWIDREIQV